MFKEDSYYIVTIERQGLFMNYLATFYTHSGAVKYQRYMRKEGIPVELLPVPRQVSSNCGIAAKFTMDQDITKYIGEDMEKLFKVTDDGYILIYNDEQV